MKHLLPALLLVSFASSSALADSPEAILKDYRKQAAQAVERLNQSLEKTATPIITKLVKDGDTDGAELLTSQLKEKLAGEPVVAPQASAASLFTMYDEARAKALAPVQKSSIARIDSLLKTAGGAKLETLTELGKVRAEIENGNIKAQSGLPVEWSYMQSLDDKSVSDMWLRPDGIFEMMDRGELKKGNWKPRKNGIEINYGNDIWKVVIVGDVGTIQRDVGTRYMKVKGK